ncbi:hypothetical protein IU433_14995 [Nocardia puris]|uniref:Secreted protein n=1 Tax=Nocardia puris TaxID=208602 RepID=A0A366DCW2_9NOCA|nr:hypothetical protein [Nocardia puris]MBF6214603.1 hypothetical protein [Nocardia puris]MBF6366012.1 hypothetical protein [Nocardia puris]MBF6460345.1 hypothetical protein [Nocardia puris]RBO87339.1 hypothetical protein DFR74_11145 [Nocardia puris]
MRIKSIIAAGLLAVAAVAGASAAGTAGAMAPHPSSYEGTYSGYQGTYIGTYATLAACRADGESPSTGGYYWECVETWDGWDLYIYY